MATQAYLDESERGVATILRPPKRGAVADAVAETLYVTKTDRWDPTVTPYMVRPLNETANRRNPVVCYMGPARTGKTLALALGRYVYVVTRNPADLMIVHSSRDLARDFSQRDLERAHKNSPALRNQLTGKAKDANTYDRGYSSGIRSVIGWPSGTQLASRTLSTVVMTDYDRWPGDVGQEGSGFAQGWKRVQAAKSAGVAIVESSPGSIALRETADNIPWSRPQFVLGKPLKQEAPPTYSGSRGDIAQIYNNGTREWWYVPCEACGEYYPQWADISMFSWGDHPDPTVAAKSAGTVCCWCGVVHSEETKYEENLNGVWLAEGEVIDWMGTVTGESRKGRTYTSFWQGGGSAAYQTRSAIVLKHLEGVAEFERSGDDKALRVCHNADVGTPYLPRTTGVVRTPHPLAARAYYWKQYHVPEGVRFLVAAVDVQKHRFVVQVVGYGEGRQRWIIDRYNLINSGRKDSDGKDIPVDPAAYEEDWFVLDKLLTKSYPLADESGRHMRILLTGCDSGGAAGVTHNANTYWRRIKSMGQSGLFRLLKGANRPMAKELLETFPDAQARGAKNPASWGDVPLLTLNTGRYKDRLAGHLTVDEPAPGYVHFPSWLKMWFYEELTREQRTLKGWPEASRNEAWDLLNYADALADWGPASAAKHNARGIGHIAWSAPPAWAAPWESNTMVYNPTEPGDSPDIDVATGLFCY